jgi:hypothetical protein
VTRRQPREVGAVGDLLRRPVATTVLPDVMENREPTLGRELGDRVEQRIVGAAAGKQLDTDRTARRAALDLGQRMSGVIRIDRRVHPNERLLARRDLEHRVVSENDVVRRRKVRRRSMTVGTEHRRDMPRYADPLTSPEPRSVDLAPVGTSCFRMIEVRVNVDEWLSARESAHSLPCSSSRSATNAALAPASTSRTASSSCAIEA